MLPLMADGIKRRWLLVVAGFCFLCLSQLRAVEIGMERILLVHELGRPTYSVTRGNTELMTYPGGVHLTLKDGRVVEMVGIKSAAGATAAPSPVVEAPAERAPTKAEADEFAKMEKEQAESESKVRSKMEKSIEEMENAHDHVTDHAVPKFNGKEFAVKLVLKWVLTLAALKLACKYWGVEVFGFGLLTVALVDVLLRGAVGAIGFVLLQMTSLFYADEALAAVAMVVVLRKVSINQSLAQAVQITITTKTFSIVVGSMLLTVVLHLIG